MRTAISSRYTTEQRQHFVHEANRLARLIGHIEDQDLKILVHIVCKYGVDCSEEVFDSLDESMQVLRELADGAIHHR